MKGFENEDLFRLITVKEAEELFGGTMDRRGCKYHHRLIDEIAVRSAFNEDPKSLRQAIDIGAIICKDTWFSSTDIVCDRIMIDAGHETSLHHHQPFILSRNYARLAAILAMRAIRQKGSIYRDPARMVGRAIWAQRAYYLDCVEESGRILKK